MDTDMEYLPINNIKREPNPASDANENSPNNNNQAAPDSVENKVSEHWKRKPHVKHFIPLPSGVD